MDSHQRFANSYPHLLTSDAGTTMQAASLNNNDPNACNNNVVEVSLFHNQITSFILLIFNLSWNKLKINNKIQKIMHYNFVTLYSSNVKGATKHNNYSL